MTIEITINNIVIGESEYKKQGHFIENDNKIHKLIPGSIGLFEFILGILLEVPKKSPFVRNYWNNVYGIKIKNSIMCAK